jgi:metal-dependent amidase/aminoacylase/carboxypeptidase family protein
MRNNLVLAKLFQQNLASLGRQVELFNPSHAFGSTDMGNISQLIPAIHASVAIAHDEIVVHSPQFAEAAASAMGFHGLLDSAKALAMTVVDLLKNPETVTEAQEEFRRSK